MEKNWYLLCCFNLNTILYGKRYSPTVFHHMVVLSVSTFIYILKEFALNTMGSNIMLLMIFLEASRNFNEIKHMTISKTSGADKITSL